MSLKSKSDALFPPDYSYNAIATTRFKTDIVISQSGREQRNITWQDNLMEFDVSHTLKTEEQKEVLLAFFNQMRGAAISFKFKNWSDYTVKRTQGIVNEDGFFLGTPTAHLYKKYQVDNTFDYYSKKIIRVVESPDFDYYSFEYNLNGTLNSGVTLDYKTGILTLPKLRTISVSNITREEQAQVTTLDLHNYQVGDYAYFVDLNYMSFLNNKSYKIIEIVDNNNFIIDVDTTSATQNGIGYIEVYYGPRDTFWWQGEYYVSVRFAEDAGQVVMNNYKAYDFPVRFVEERN